MADPTPSVWHEYMVEVSFDWPRSRFFAAMPGVEAACLRARDEVDYRDRRLADRIRAIKQGLTPA